MMTLLLPEWFIAGDFMEFKSFSSASVGMSEWREVDEEETTFDAKIPQKIKQKIFLNGLKDLQTWWVHKFFTT